MVEDMQPEAEEMRLGAQQALDELVSESLIPFKLSTRLVESMGHGEFIVRFHNRQLPSLDVSWEEGQSFKNLVRVAILSRLSRMTSRMPNSRVA